MEDDAINEIGRVIAGVRYGEFQISGKMHEGEIATLSIPYSKTIKVDFTKASAYVIDSFREAQFDGFTGAKTFTITFTNGQPKILSDHGFVTKKFSV